MYFSKLGVVVLCFSLKLIAHEHGPSELSFSSRASTPDTVPHGSFVMRTLDGTSVVQSATSSFAILLTPHKSPPKAHRTHEDLNRLLGGEFLQKLFPDTLPKSLADFVLQHPDSLIAVVASAYAYLDEDLHKKSSARPDAIIINTYIKLLDFQVEKLADDLIVLTRTTEDDIKQAWFSIAGTNSITNGIRNAGIATHMNARDYHNFIVSVWLDHVAPKLYARNSYADRLFNYVSTLPLNLYYMVSIACLTFSTCVFSQIPYMENVYTAYLGFACFIIGIGVSVVCYFNLIPHVSYKIGYKPRTDRLLELVCKHRKALEDKGYVDFFVTGHSAGGHGAQILGLLTGMRAFSFNAPGGALKHARWVYDSAHNKDGLIQPTVEGYKNNILAVVVNKDPVSALQHEHDPVQPIQVDLEGEHGIIGVHRILPLLLHVTKAAKAASALISVADKNCDVCGFIATNK